MYSNMWLVITKQAEWEVNLVVFECLDVDILIAWFVVDLQCSIRQPDCIVLSLVYCMCVLCVYVIPLYI